MRIRKNGKVINLTESDLRRIIKRVVSESEEYGMMDVEADFPDMEVASDEMSAEVDVTDMEMGYSAAPSKIGGASKGKLWYGNYVYKLEVEYGLFWYELYVTKLSFYGDGVLVSGTKMGYTTSVGIKPDQWNAIVKHIYKGTTPITFTLNTDGASNSSTTTNAWTGTNGYKGLLKCRLTRTY